MLLLVGRGIFFRDLRLEEDETNAIDDPH